MKKFIFGLLVFMTFLMGCYQTVKPVNKTVVKHKPRRVRMKYSVNEPFSVLSNRVVQGSNKTAVALSPTNLVSGYTGKNRTWKLTRDISRFPQLNIPQYPIVETLYNMALEESLEDILTKQQAFMAGKKWMGVWTRDISYSIHLSLALILPDIAYNSLKFKVNNIPAIIQDTGTGGSWPVSSDRVVWALGAWQVYLVTGNKNQLEWIYTVLKNTALADRHVVYDVSDGLYHGESSFMDWREQSYPKWMTPVNIFESKALSTQMVHYELLSILAQAGKLLDKKKVAIQQWANWAVQLKDAINKQLWMSDKNYYSSYKYPSGMGNIISDKSDALGEALSVISGVAQNRQNILVENIPTVHFGVPCLYPQQPHTLPYHNKGIWPFVEAYYAWAAAQTGNENAVVLAFDSMTRAAALFRSHKENMTYNRGHDSGTAINSKRQLWSVAGYLSLVYRVLFGIRLTPDGMEFHPFVPQKLAGTTILKNFSYRNAVLSITLKGSGNHIQNFLLDGKPSKAFLSVNLKGTHSVEILLSSSEKLKNSKINVVSVKDIAPMESYVKLNVKKGASVLTWSAVKKAVGYEIFANGNLIAKVKTTTYSIKPPKKTIVYTVRALNKENIPSNFSRPIWVIPDNSKISLEVEDQSKTAHTKFKGYTGKGYVYLAKPKDELSFKLPVLVEGNYVVRFRYANGSGPISTDNKCATRSLFLDNKDAGTVVFPQLGDWNRWDFSSLVHIKLKKGKHLFRVVRKLPWDRNMNKSDINRVAVDKVELIRVD